MKQRVRGLTQAGLASVGIAMVVMLFAGGTAQAVVCESPGQTGSPGPSSSASEWDSGDNTGVGDGNQVGAPVDVPGEVVCNGVGVLGGGIGGDCATKSPGGTGKPSVKPSPSKCVTPSASGEGSGLPVTGTGSLGAYAAVALLLLTAGGALVYAARRRAVQND